MVQARDPSTLASLHPAYPLDPRFREYRTAPRLTGSHLMTLRRPSRAPESGREYVRGDPVHLIDWKAFARTDRLIVREVRDEAMARVAIGLDLTETMHWPQVVPGGGVVTAKCEIAWRLALNLAHLHLKAGDLVELWLVPGSGEGGGAPQVFKPKRPAELVALYDELDRAKFVGTGEMERFHRDLGLPSGPRDVTFWLGDGLGSYDFGSFLALGKRSLHWHVLSSRELDIGWIDSDTSYFDEGDGLREYQGQVLRTRSNYLNSLKRWREKLESRQRQRGGEYVLVSETTATWQYQRALTEFIKG